MKTLKHPSYTYCKGGVYYFSKVVPQGLADFYAKPRIVRSLRTKSLSHAKTASRSLSERLEAYWLGLRLQKADVPEIADYCSFMQEQSLVVDGEPLSEYQVIRTFRDWAGNGSFLYGDRGCYPVMPMKKVKRSRILINGRKTVALDYPVSEPNILYQMMTGKRLSPDGDPYGLPRIC